VIEAEGIADALDLTQPPKKVEAAMHKLGEASAITPYRLTEK
jgi:hypothetical protein